MTNFTIPSNTAVYTSKYVLQDKQPVLHVTHDADGDWQFHCGNNDFSNEKIMLVALSKILDFDNGLNELSDLPLNHQATRGAVGDKWVYSQSN